MPLQIRRGTEAERLSLTSANGLLQGELLYNTSDKRVYIGTGVGGEHQGIPVTGYTDENAQDAVSTMFTGGSHAGITFSYNDSANTLNATVDLSNYEGVLKADAFNGTLVADDSSVLVDAVDGKINLDGTVKGNIIPNVNEAYDIGSASYKFKDLYLSGSSIYLGTANITATAGVVNLPAGSTIGGVAIGQDTGSVNSDLYGSVFADDSTLLVDAIDGKLLTSGITIDIDEIYTTNSEALSLYSSAGSSQLQVKFPVVAASTTGGDLLTAAGNWKFIEILGSKTSLTPTSDLVSGDVLGVFGISGVQSNGVDMGAIIGAQVDPAGTPGSSWIPSKLFFGNSPDNIGAVTTPLMTFDSFGRLAVNQQNAQATLDVNGFAKLAILDTAPASPANGMIAIASGDQGGGEWDPLGSGAKQQMVVYLGGGWRQIAVEP